MVAVDSSHDEAWLSDDSDFYGPRSTIKALETTLRSTSPSAYWRIHSSLPSVIAYAAQNADKLNSKDGGKSRLYYPFEGIASHLQPSESPSDFLARLPPRTTTLQSIGPWIWVDNPHLPYDSTASATKTLEAKGTTLLTTFRRFESQTRAAMPDKPESSIGKKLAPARKQLEADLKALAGKTGCVDGKWMLFPQADDVNGVWLRVCEGVVAGRLGTSAKVGTAGTERADGERVVCVYTKDFADVVDVRRVLEGMVELGLVDAAGGGGAGKGIWYKCNAYTALGIESKNEFKLKASMYGSVEMLSKTQAVVGNGEGTGKRRR